MIVTDSKSLVKSIKKLRKIAGSNKIMLSTNPSLEDLKDFTTKMVYKYSKTHTYALTLQSILLKIMIREHQQLTTKVYHVYSHFLDHEMEGTQSRIPKDKWEEKWNKMTQKY